MNKTLFFASLKANWKLLLGTFLVLAMYQSVIIGMYDPESVEAMKAMIEAFPEGMMSAFGYDLPANDLTGHMGTYLYGFLMLVFPLMYVVPAGNNLMAKHVDRGSMAYLLGTPNTRIRIARTQAVFFVSSTLLLFFSVVLFGMLMSESLFPGELIYGDYLLLNLVTVAVYMVLCGIAFLASCTFNESRGSIMAGLGIPGAFLIFKMMSAASDQLEGLKYATLFSLIDVPRIFEHSGYALLTSGILIAVSVLLFVLAIRIFNKRGLNI
ncbi:MAG: ABC transporter permease subunit [Candidatus Marinimicrobia bacterium]|nr:ABC transporter permease subunit [Candidatus Neomarinimicrobiota bacterium]